jgi:peroxiredoxin
VTEVGYTKIAAVSKDPPEVLSALRLALGAPFPFLSDAELRLTDALGIREHTDQRHGPLPVPFTFALLPDLTVHRVFNGWYMAGRPTPEELRQAMRALLRATQPDFDFAGD